MNGQGSDICMYESETENDSVVSDSLWPHGLHSPWNSPGQNTGVGFWTFPSPGDLAIPGIEPGSFALQVDSLPAEPPGKLYIYIEREREREGEQQTGNEILVSHKKEENFAVYNTMDGPGGYYA